MSAYEVNAGPRRRRTLGGEGMLTPTRRITLGNGDVLLPARDRLAPTHPLALRFASLMTPCYAKESSPEICAS